MKSLNYIILFIVVSGFTKICGQTCDINGKKHYNYDDVRLILDKNECNSCHNGTNSSTSWNYQNYESIFKFGKCNIAVIKNGSPNQSLLIDKLNGGPTSCGSPMPLGRNKISSSDLLAIESWVTFGSPEFCIPEFEEIKSILTVSKCGSCHSNASNWQFNTYSNIFLKPQGSICTDSEIIKNNAQESLLYKKLISDNYSCGDRMLVDGQPMSANNIAKIRDWINAGAPESFKVLPVSLVEFSTKTINDQSILITWSTASEINTSHFTVEYSVDGFNYTPLGNVQGGNASGSEYSYLHTNINAGFNYYRLNIKDYDSSFSYSPIRVEKISNSDEIFRIYPVPMITNTDFTIEWYPTDNREKVRLNLIDIHGKLTQEYTLSNGINNLQIGKIPAGLYYISIEDYNANRILKKVIILDL